MSTRIMAVRIEGRTEKAPDVQEILTHYGCNIKMRLGLHETSEKCKDEGLILMELTGECKDLEKELDKIDGVKLKTMTI